MDIIGKIIATEKQPSTIEDFTFWTKKDLKLKPFDVVAVEHINNSLIPQHFDLTLFISS